MFKMGNMYFCKYCQNIMLVSTDNEILIWHCSIDCQNGDNNKDENINNDQQVDDSLIVLSESNEEEVHDNQINNFDDNFTSYDPTLLRCKVHCKNCNDEVEAIVFKENVAKNNCYFKCINCKNTITPI